MDGEGFPGGSRKRVNKAGDRVREGAETNEDYAVINEWRAAHRHVINTFQASLRQRAKVAGDGIHVGQRLKRLNTILDKLEREPKMDLGRMDDVAGVRLIFPSVERLYEFRGQFHQAHFQHERRSKDDQYDYIQRPKRNGYRGVHDIYAYRSKQSERAAGLFIEVQYRTLVQHAWATANEVVGYVTDSEPKFDRGDEHVRQFMTVCSEILARGLEGRYGPFPELPTSEVVEMFRDLDEATGVLRRLATLRVAKMDLPKRAHYILIFNREGQLEIKEYDKNQRALAALFKIEAQQPDSNVVLVGASTPEEMQFTFRNYFSNTTDFIQMLHDAMRVIATTEDKAESTLQQLANLAQADLISEPPRDEPEDSWP
jgi:ppGpp synthetase/RelA/SpoT-type nucleotidyltranferase